MLCDSTLRLLDPLNGSPSQAASHKRQYAPLKRQRTGTSLTYVSFISMVEPNETGQVVERASAAIAEARRLLEENRELRLTVSFRIKRLYYRSSFGPKTLRIYAPQDFPEQARPPYRLFPSRDDGQDLL